MGVEPPRERAVPLKIELKPNERFMIGDCAVTNAGGRTRLVIEGDTPILREKDIMPLGRADTPAKRIYLVVQLMYTSQHAQDHDALYRKLTREMLKARPGARPFVEAINNRILTGDLYKALKETRKLIAYEKDAAQMNHASKTYAKIAKETASPRDLEATLLLKAAAKLQEAQEAWTDKSSTHAKPAGLDEALIYNRRLWTVFIDAVMRDDNKLPKQVCHNLTALGMRVMADTFSLMTKPQPENLATLININRGIAAGLRGKA
jgi:flagellar biosynthesis repressor protein FlbT